MNEQYAPYVSVIDPISTAIERVKVILFKPFDPGKWFVIGFCAFLANLCNGNGGGSGGGGGGSSGGGGPQDIGQFVSENLAVIIIVVAAVMLVGFIIGIILLWLSSRGRFMFLHCVARNKGEVKVPWRKYRRQGNSLFLFRLVIGFLGFLCFGLLIGGAIFLGIVLARGTGPGPVIMVVVVTLLLLPLGIVFGVIEKFTKDFVVPLMYMRESTCMEGWGEFMSLLSANKGRFTLYILFQIVIGMAIGMIVMAVMFATCCCAACIMAIPYIGTVFMLPIFVFGRSYSLYYLGQYGPPYDAFAKAGFEWNQL